MTITEIVDRAIENSPSIDNIEGYYSLLKEADARAACLAVAKATRCATLVEVREQAIAVAWDAIAIANWLLDALAAQAPRGEEGK